MNYQDDDIAQAERDKYLRTWEFPEYRTACHSLTLWQQKRSWFPTYFGNAIDLGCGTGRLFAIWNNIGIDAWGFDIAENCLDPEIRERWGHKAIIGCLWRMDIGRKFEFGICTDVLEHIPPTKVTATLEHIAGTCTEVLFKIAHEPNALGNEKLHLTLQDATWWVAVMESVGGSAQLLGKVTRSGFLDSVVRWRP